MRSFNLIMSIWITKFFFLNKILFCVLYKRWVQINGSEKLTFETQPFFPNKKLSMNIKELNLDVSEIFSTFVKNNPYSYHKNELLIK